MFRKSSDGTQYRQSFLSCMPRMRRKGQNMSGTNSRRARHTFGGKGFYIALFLGVTALAVAGYRTLLPSDTAKAPVSSAVEVTLPDEQPTNMPELPVPETEIEPVQAIHPLPQVEQTPAIEEIPADSPEEDVPVIDIAPVEPQLIVSPLTGETIAPRSADALAYNETLGDWRTHEGIDIAAEVGTPVLSACSGSVLSVTEDDLLGTCVTIAHDGGYESTYANLQSVPTVAAGQYVSAGQVIGAVGTTSLIESSSAPHLHFSVTKDGAPYDPEQFLK